MNTEKIASLIKTLRQKDNLTQNEFAKKFGVTYQTEYIFQMMFY